jgi:hypothetical protein
MEPFFLKIFLITTHIFFTSFFVTDLSCCFGSCSWHIHVSYFTVLVFFLLFSGAIFHWIHLKCLLFPTFHTFFTKPVFIFIFEVLTLVTLKNTIFCDVRPCSLTVYWCFGGMYCLHLQHKRVSQASDKQ